MYNHLAAMSRLVEAFYGEGVRHAVVSPGSRSTPVTLALAIHEGIKKHVLIDERSAAFAALGISKTMGTPAILACTSGTAAANYFPAIVEAKYSGVPLIILTADRPASLRSTGASQTIDQIKLYGDHAVFFHEAGEIPESVSDYDRLDFLARQAFQESILRGGAAHINLPFRKPLEPSPDELEKQKQAISKNYRSSVIATGSEKIEYKLPESFIHTLKLAKKPLIMAGPANPSHNLAQFVVDITNGNQIPLVAEPGSGLAQNGRSAFGRYDQFLRDPEALELLKPDCIIRTGDLPFSKSLQNALENWNDVPLFHFTRRNSWQGIITGNGRRFVIPGHATCILDKITVNTDPAWFEFWKQANSTASNFLSSTLSETESLTDAHFFHYFPSSKFNSGNVMLSNSFIVRDMALFGKSERGFYVNRGAAGIDGIISTALGIHIGSDEPVCCITGDIAFLHDSNALISLRKYSRNFVIIVINNGGGTIFRMLPVSGYEEYFTEYFETPQNIQIAKLASAHHIDYKLIDSLRDLRRLDDPNKLDSPLIIEIKTSAGQSMSIRKKLWGHCYLKPERRK